MVGIVLKRNSEMENKSNKITRPKNIAEYIPLLKNCQTIMLTYEIDGRSWNFYWLPGGSTILTDCGFNGDDEKYKEICEFGKLEGMRHFFQTVEVFRADMPKWVKLYKKDNNITGGK